MKSYKLEIACSGADSRLTILDAAQWALGDHVLVFGAGANPQPFSTLVQQPYVHVRSGDGYTKVASTLSIYVSTDLGTLSLRVMNDGVITVKSPVDKFVVRTPGQTDHVLKLR